MFGADRKGPKEVVIPEQRYQSCYGCEYYDHHMVQSGMNPIYASTCSQPDIGLKHHVDIFRGNLNGDKTPDWCPYLKTVKDQLPDFFD